MSMKLISNQERERLATIKAFLKSENLSLRSLAKIKGDASFRTYYRIKNSDLILMDADPKTNEKISSFIKVQKILSQYGVRVPEIYKKNVSSGLMIIEDLGMKRFLDYSDDSKFLLLLYRECGQELGSIHNQSILKPSEIKNLKKYTLNEQMKETELFFDWYLEKHLNKTILDSDRKKFRKIFRNIYKKLNIKNYCLVLRDFHVDNIIPTQVPQKYDGKTPISSKYFNLGIIDFQDALVGSPAYDLSSLIEDVRAPINEEMKKKIIFIYKVATKGFIKNNSSKIGKPDPQWHKFIPQYEDEDLYYKLKNIAEDTFNDFETKVSYFSIQRNLKILGIFCRLKYRDKKTTYIKYLPQAKKFVRDNLKNPQFEELKNWFIENKINV